jgi:hypothetical protein
MTEMPHPGSGPHDLMDLLTRQHEQIDALMQRVLAEKGAARKRAFGDVRAVLSRHEAAEQDLLRPLTRTVPDGDVTASARLREEGDAEGILAELADMDPGSISFEVLFKQLQAAVLEHADAEEHDEFPLLRMYADPGALAAAREKFERGQGARRS